MSSLSLSQLDLLTVAGGSLLLCLLYLTMKRNAGPPLPPGPKPLPLIGNALELPIGRDWEIYNRWADEYGDIVHVTSYGKHIIILNSYDAVYELLERRSSIYSNRSHLTMFHEMLGFGGSTSFQPYGKTWRKHRTLYHKQMNSVAVRSFEPSQLSLARGLLRSLRETPNRYREHIRHMAAGVAMGISYGHDILPKSDPYVVLAERNAIALAQSIRPGAFLVDSFPILKHVPAWFPGAGFKKYAERTRKDVEEARDVPFRNVKAQLAAGTARPSFVANELLDLGKDDESDEDVDAIKRVAGSIFGAGSETTTSAVSTFILAMILYPDIQKKAQAELDSVVGQDRLPHFNDRPHLPYLAAVVKESFRWIPVVPTNIPHVSTEEDVYEGYRIPAKSVVLANSRRLLHDPVMYPKPHIFIPERFLPDKNGNVARDPVIGGAFGFGRRGCAGRHLAEASVWIAAASMLSVFNITTAVDEHGQNIDVSFACDPTPGFISHPRTFKCSLTSRSPEAEALIQRRD